MATNAGHPLFHKLGSGPREEKVKKAGFTFSVWQAGSGKWHAGSEGSTGDTRSAAVDAHVAHARQSQREDDARYAEQAKAADAKRAARAGKECTLTYCNGAIDTPAHRQTATHRNAVAVDNQRHANDRF